MADTKLSDRKRSRLQALERRMETTSSPSRGLPSSKRAASTASTASTQSPVPATPSFRLSSTANQTAPIDEPEKPMYAKICSIILSGLAPSELQLSQEIVDENAVDSIIREIISDTGKSARELDSVLDSRVQDKFLLLDNPAGINKAALAAKRRAKQILAGRSSRHLSNRQQKILGSFNLPYVYRKFELFKPVHHLWKTYAKQIVEENKGKEIEPYLSHMDLHGAFIAVVEAKVTNQVGVEGIMIRETTNTYSLITKDNKMKVIPKAGSVFIFRLDDMCVTWYGDRAVGRGGSLN